MWRSEHDLSHYIMRLSSRDLQAVDKVLQQKGMLYSLSAVRRHVFTANVRGLYLQTRSWNPRLDLLVFSRGCIATEILLPGYRFLFSLGYTVTGRFSRSLCFAFSPVHLIHLIMLLHKNTTLSEEGSLRCHVVWLTMFLIYEAALAIPESLALYIWRVWRNEMHRPAL